MELGIAMCKRTATEAFDAWWEIMIKQHTGGFLQPSRAGNVVGEVLNAVTVIEDPTRGIVNSKIREMSMRYAVGELLWYLSGSNMVSGITPYSKVWEGLSDDGDTINSAYGHRIHYRFNFDQWEDVKERLIQDPFSRQAIIHIKDPQPITEVTKDTPCTICLQYSIRPDMSDPSDPIPRLYATTYMRSNDLWLGFPYDVFSFTAFQVKLAMELGVQLGTYTHIAGSLHLYEKAVTDRATEESGNTNI